MRLILFVVIITVLFLMPTLKAWSIPIDVSPLVKPHKVYWIDILRVYGLITISGVKFNMVKTTSILGIKLIKRFEGLKLKAYKDAGDIMAIGYGHTETAKMGQVITRQEAHELLLEDLSRFEEAVNNALVELTQFQFDALVSFSYNVGVGAFKRSTLLEKLNNQNYVGAADELLRWDISQGKALKGLTKRRKSERKMFMTARAPSKVCRFLCRFHVPYFINKYDNWG